MTKEDKGEKEKEDKNKKIIQISPLLVTSTQDYVEI